MSQYRLYKKGSGRDDFIKKNWHEEKKQVDLKKELTPTQFHVTQENGTEQPYQNEYWDNEEEGIYVDVISGEVLFSSKDKFDAQCGWTSFTKPVDDYQLVEESTTTHGMLRREVRRKKVNT